MKGVHSNVESLSVREQTIRQYNTDPTLCHWLQYQAANTWHRVQFSRITGLVSIFETTITQNILFDFWTLSHESSLDIALFQSMNEKVNGNDLELFVKLKNGRYRFLPVQAKILYDNNHYTAIDHGKPTKYQLEKLIQYAKDNKGIPYYLLYNFHADPAINENIEKHYGGAVELLGCSMVNANDIKNEFYSTGPPAGFHTIPSFTDVHPSKASPWHHLICPSYGSLLMQQMNNRETDAGEYTHEEVYNDRKWNLTPRRAIGYITESQVQSITTSETANEFLPKFRMVLSGDKVERKIVRNIR
jgi:hypothetical protein